MITLEGTDEEAPATPPEPRERRAKGDHRFRYVAVDLDGVEHRGEIHANSANSARNELAIQGLKVTRITERRGLRTEITKEKVSRVELMHFCRQMATFLRAGVPMTEALDELRLDAKPGRFRTVLADALDRVTAGRSLADALDEHGDIAPSYFMATLRSAELTGRMDDSFEQLTTYIRRDVELSKQVRKALLYPMILLFLAVAVCLLMAVFVIPRFAAFFEGFDAELPLPTRMLVAVSDFVQSGAGAATAVVLTLTVVGTVVALRTPAGRRRFQAFQLRVPVLSTVVSHAASERFTRVLSALLDAGVALPEALPTAVASTQNSVFQERLDAALDDILGGHGFAEPLAATELFPRTVIQMVRVGERTGELADQLEGAARYFQEELDHAVDRLTALFEPIITVFVGCIVGFVALAMVSAMYGIYGQVDF